MIKYDVINKIKEFADSKNYSDNLIQRCLYIVDKMAITPRVREICDEIFDFGIAFNYDKNGLAVEIIVSKDEIWGNIDYNDNQFSSFAFETDEDAVNFWNVILSKEF